MKSTNNLQIKYILFFLLTLWAAIFAAKGALFQLSLYAFPVLIICLPQFRTTILSILWNNGSKLAILLIIPGLLTVSILIISGDTFDMKSTSDLFDVFWRLIVFPAAISTFFLVQSELRRWILPVLLLIPLVYAVGGFLELANFSGSLSSGWRMKGFVGNPNGFGFVMGSGLLISLGYMLSVPTKTVKQRLLLFCNPLLCIPCLVLSGSRGAWLSTILAIAVLIILEFSRLNSSKLRGRIIRATVSTISLIGLLFFTSPIMSDRLSHCFTDSARTKIWGYYLALMDGHWWVGLSGYYQQLYLLHPGYFVGPHNIYLDALIRYGIPGLAGWLLLFGWLVVHIKKHYWNSYGKLAISGLVIVLAAGFVDFSTYTDAILQAPLAMVIAISFFHPAANKKVI